MKYQKDSFQKMSNYEQNLVKLFGNDYVDNLVPSEEELEQKYSIEDTKQKGKSLFDHITAICTQPNNYFENLTEVDKKSWSNYMVHRFLSMKMEWVDFVNDVQKYWTLEPKDVYKLYTSILPRKKQWLKYIKGDKKMKYPTWVYEIVAKHLQCSIRESNDAVEMYEISAGGQAELKDILMKYGKTEQECRKLGL